MARNKRAQQTIKRTVDQQSKRNPRMNLRGNLSENVTHVVGNEYNEAIKLPISASEGTQRVYLAPGNAAGRANAPVNNIGKLFQLGVYLPGTKLTYIPSVGLNSPGNIVIGFLDNPSAMAQYFGLATDALKLSFIYDLSNIKTGPVWQQIEFPLTQAPRRRLFNVDTNIGGNIDDFDQSIQGLFVVGAYGCEAASATTTKTIGQLVIHCKERFEEVKSFSTG